MKKKVKKIPKYGLGTEFVDNWKKMSASERSGAITGAISAAAPGVASALGIEQGKNAQIANAIAAGLDLVPILGEKAGDIVRTFGAFAGEGGHVDLNTGEYTKSSGLTRLFGFGRNDSSILRESNRIKNANIARQHTEDLQANWMNQGINPAPNTLAAEGAIIDNSTQVLVSPGELIYDYKNKTLTKVPFGNGKPNTDDNVFMKVEQGDKKAVINNKADMYTTVDGKTLAMQLEPMIDKPNKKFSKGTIDARDAIVKKALHIQEQHKTGSQEHAAFNTGIDSIDKVLNNAKERGKITLSATVDGKNYVKLGDGFWYTAREGKADKRVILSKKLRKAFSDVEKENIEKNANFTEGYDQNWESMSPIMQQPLAKALFGLNKKYGLFTPNKMVERAGYSYGPSHNNHSVKFDIPDVKIMDIPSDYGTYISAVKPISSNAVSNNKPELPVLSKEEIMANMKAAQNTEDVGERHWLRGPVETKSLARVAFENAPKPIAPPFTVLKPEQDADVNYSNPSWQDWLYRTALLTQPLWDRAKAEPVQYEIPNAKYVPTGVDVSGQLRDVSEGYALSRYNFANLYPNTGAGMAAGLQAASTAAKQRADIHQYKTDAQNKLIGANVGIYNNWANRRAEILNDMYNKAAANRASARNINRQNRAAALSNYGQMLRDDKQYAMDTLKLDALTPLIMYGTENSDTLIKKARQILNK